MIAVKPSRANRSTVFHTSSTDPQVVSTRTQPMSASRRMISVGAPKAGSSTTSSAVRSSYETSPW